MVIEIVASYPYLNFLNYVDSILLFSIGVAGVIYCYLSKKTLETTLGMISTLLLGLSAFCGLFGDQVFGISFLFYVVGLIINFIINIAWEPTSASICGFASTVCLSLSAFTTWFAPAQKAPLRPVLLFIAGLIMKHQSKEMSNKVYESIDYIHYYSTLLMALSAFINVMDLFAH